MTFRLWAQSAQTTVICLQSINTNGEVEKIYNIQTNTKHFRLDVLRKSFKYNIFSVFAQQHFPRACITLFLLSQYTQHVGIFQENSMYLK